MKKGSPFVIKLCLIILIIYLIAFIINKNQQNNSKQKLIDEINCFEVALSGECAKLNPDWYYNREVFPISLGETFVEIKCSSKMDTERGYALVTKTLQFQRVGHFCHKPD